MASGRRGFGGGGFPTATQIRRAVLGTFRANAVRVTPSGLCAAMRYRFPEAKRARIFAAIRDLVESQDLVYTTHHSVSCLEKNPEKPRKVSRRIVLSGIHPRTMAAKGCVTVRLLNGAAFGRGDHPTTQLCLQGLDYAVDQLLMVPLAINAPMALDVGAGTGVLAIASVLLGIGRAVAIDTDPVACREASHNVAANGLSECILILNGDMGCVGVERFHLLMANLRPPTLAALLPDLVSKSPAGAYWVLSGFRPGEFKGIGDLMPAACTVVWQRMERGWGAAVVRVS